MLRRWEKWGQAKVTVQVKSEEELFILQAQAMSLGLCAKIIHDASGYGTFKTSVISFGLVLWECKHRAAFGDAHQKYGFDGMFFF